MRQFTGRKLEYNEEIVVCDFCGKPCNASPTNQNGLEQSATLNFDFGWFSNRDGDNWSWDACNICADRLAGILSMEIHKDDEGTEK